MTTASKAAVTARFFWSKIRKLRSLKIRLRHRTFPLFRCALEPPVLGDITVDDRHKLFLAASVCKAIKVAYLPAC